MRIKLEQHPKDFGCAVCAADLSGQVEEAVHEGYQVDEHAPNRITLHCPKCRGFIEFRLEWELVLRHAEPIPYEMMP